MGQDQPGLHEEALKPMNCKSLLFRRARTRRAAPPNGFTLMELLIVMAIILILMLMAIPTVGHLKKAANETSAINSMQVITKAELSYSNTYPINGFACTLTAMGGDPASGAPTAAAAQILQPDLVSGYKSGYIFAVVCKDKVTVNGQDRYNSYTVTAIPQTVGKTGDRGFCESDSGTITFDPAGATNCTQPLSQ